MSISMSALRFCTAGLIGIRINSKATLRLLTKDFLPLVPKLLHDVILASRYYADNTKSLIIQSDETRTQLENIKTCYQKLHMMVIAAGRSRIRGETSQAQVEKVKALYVMLQIHSIFLTD